jgi:hypothetical protein
MFYMSRLAFWGSLASIVGLAITLYPVGKAQSGNQTTYGNQSPAIGSVDGNVTINYGGASTSEQNKAKPYVLRNTGGGSVLVMKQPDLTSFNDAEKQICTVFAGTSITLLGEESKHQGLDWQKVKINEGPCIGKIGWVVHRNISNE